MLRTALLLLALALPAAAQAPPGLPQPPTPPGAPTPAPKPAPTAFRLTVPQTLPHKDGKLVRVEATGADEVAWDVEATPPAELDLVLSPGKLAFPMPAPGTVVRVVAAAVVAGKPAVAKTTVTITGGGGGAGTGENPDPVPPPTGNVRNATLVYRGAAESASLLRLFASAEAKRQTAARGVKLRALDANDKDPAVQALGFSRFLPAAGGASLVLQDAAGNLVPQGKVFRLLFQDDDAANLKGLLDAIDGANKP